MAGADQSKTYEEMIAKACSRIGFYSDTWTGRNPSDPGITILENLTAFQLLQYNQLTKTPARLSAKWLELLGMKPEEGRAARVLLQAENLTEELPVPKGRQFFAANHIYETERDIRIMPSKLYTVYAGQEEKPVEIVNLRHGNPLAAELFGAHPAKGDTVYFLFDKIPALPGETFCLYVLAKEKYPRNQTEEGQSLPEFAAAEWSYYTEKGYEKAEAKDDTGVFLRSGEIRVRLCGDMPVQGRIGSHEGFILRCVLTKADYDIAPLVACVDGPLFEVYETERKARIYHFHAKEKEKIELLQKKEQYCSFYIKEGDGYREWGGKDFSRFYEDKEMCAVCYTEDMITRKDLGILKGCDDQEFDVSELGMLKTDHIVLMARGEERDARFRFFEPGEGADGDVLFTYDSMKRVIRIRHPGRFAGSKLSLAACSVYHGAAGNIRRHNPFSMRECSKLEFFNPAEAAYGKDPETLQDGLCRLREWISRPESAVRKEDYEYLVKQIPGLCIHKVTAFVRDGVIYVCVKPYGETPFPVLSSIYRTQIETYLRERRMLNTRVEVIGPAYIPVDVQGVIYVESRYLHSRQEVEACIRKSLDYVNGSQQFGEPVHFRKVYNEIRKLEFVTRVQELKLSPVINGIRQKTMVGEDVNLPPEGLCYGGRLSLKIKQASMV